MSAAMVKRAPVKVPAKSLKVGDRFRTGADPALYSEFEVVWASPPKRAHRATGAFVYARTLVVKGPWGTETMNVSDAVWLNDDEGEEA